MYTIQNEMEQLPTFKQESFKKVQQSSNKSSEEKQSSKEKISDHLSISSKDCTVCILSPVYSFGEKLGLSQIESHCVHIDKTSCQPEFKFSKKGLIIPIAMLILLVSTIVFQVYILRQTCDGRSAMMSLSDLLFSASCITLVLDMPFLTRGRLTIMNAWVELGNSARNYGLESLVTSKKAKKIKNTHKVFMFLVHLFVWIFVIYGSWLFYSRDVDNSIVSELVTIFCMFVQILIVTQFISFSYFVSGILENCSMHIKKALSRSLLETKSRTASMLEVPQDEHDLGLTMAERLSLGRQFYMQAIAKFMNSNQQFSWYLIVWFLHLLAILIVNVYTAAKYYEHRLTVSFVMLEIRTDFLILHIIYVLHYVQNMSNVVSNLFF